MFKAVPCLRQLFVGLSPLRLWFESGPVHVGFVVDKVALGQIFLRVLRFFTVSIIRLWISILVYDLGDEKQARWWSQFRDVVSPHRR
jgi:hypothetical protein